MDAESYQALMNAYREQREADEREERRRLEDVLDKCPKIGELRTQRQDTFRLALQRAFSGTTPISIEDEIIHYNEAIGKLLEDNGFPRDYLAPVYQCEKCRDTGYEGDNIRRLCTCAKEKYAALLSKDSHFSMGQTFEAYDETVYSTEILHGTPHSQQSYMDRIRKYCEAYADALPAPRVRDMLFYGDSGLGKTFMLRCIDARARERGVPTLCVTAYQLLMQLKKAFFTNNEDLARAYFETELLLIDDLGVEPLLENVTVEQLFNVLNERRGNGLCTVISTNLSPDDIKKRYGERILSRLSDRRECMQVHFVGNDVRMRK